MAKVLKEYDIDIINLSNNKHSYGFDIDCILFENMPDSFLKEGKLVSKVLFDKSETMIQANFETLGYVQLECDRSNEIFDFAITAHNKIIFKFGDDFNELTEDIVIIPRNLQKLNIAQYLYEFIVLAIPIKKLHPRFVEDDEDEDTDTEGSLIYSTSVPKVDLDDNAEADPRWSALANLKKGKTE